MRAERVRPIAFRMRILSLIVVALPSAPVSAQSLQPGAWEVRSTVASMSIPGVPGFVERMARGRSKAERKRLAAGQGIDALLAPDPKAGCRIEDQRAADGRYDQRLSCPQRRGGPLANLRTGTYDASGFRGRAVVDGATSKGPLRIVLDQVAARVGG